jgi:predicted molibdopterin-dependent oxidoreductase YjgC
MVRKDGRLEPVSWEHAISEAAGSLGRLAAAGRPVGVLASGRASNEEGFLAAALARVGLRTGNVDAPLGAPYESLLRGLGADAGIPTPDSSFARLEESDLILVLEGDVAATHPRAASALLRALRRGGRLVTLGWSPTRMSRLAAEHLPLPSDDPLRPLRELWDRVRGSGSPSGDSGPVQRVATWLAAARRPALLLGFPQMDGALLETAAALLAAALGASRPEGDGSEGEGRVETLVPLPVRVNSRGIREMGVASHLLPGCRPLDDSDAGDRLERAWGAEPCRQAGLPTAAMLGAVEGLVVVAEDLPASAASPKDALAALGALDSLVVLDSFLTPTAKAARVVLPIAGFGERSGSVTNLEGRVQSLHAAIRPPGEAREGWIVLRELLRALGAPAPWRTRGEVFTAVGIAIPEYRSLDLGAIEGGTGDVLAVADTPAGTAREPRGAVPDLPRPPAQEAVAVGEGDPVRHDRRWVLRTEGAFEWGDDPLVSFSPTLRRDHASFRKLHPEGLVWLGPEEAKDLGIREGWKVRLRSSSGETEVAVSLRPGLGRGLVLVPFTFRDELSEVLGGERAAEVELSRV